MKSEIMSLRSVIQKSRIAYGNRLSAIDRGDSHVGPREAEIIERWHERFLSLEKEIDHDIAAVSKNDPVIKMIARINGIGIILAAKMVSAIDIRRADTISALWRYAGFAVVDGRREYPTRGEKLHYNKELKTTMHLAAKSLLKSGSLYRPIYDEAREYYQDHRQDWTPLHIHLASMRKMIKVFLAHLWLSWRHLEGLPARNPYVQDYMGHTHISQPERFGWQP